MTGRAGPAGPAGGQDAARPARPVAAPAVPPLEVKLRPPAIRPEWVQRRELVRHLAASAATLVLIEAPAGYGKTVLAAQWCAGLPRRRPSAWVSLDGGDNDPARLWLHVTLALQRASPQLNLADAVAALGTRAPDIGRSVLPVLANELTRVASPVILLLDGYDRITEPACHEQVGFLLGHVRRSLQLGLTTRSASALPLGRLRVAGDITEVGTAQLRFTADEADAMVQAVAHLRLRARDLTALLDRSEGWPAGVRLAALALRDHPSPSAFIEQFGGGSRFIADFLAEEVLDGQPAAVRQFLERTAILGRFTAPLCDAVTGSGDAAEIIEAAGRDNLFLVPLDEERLWFRYQRLFGQVLLRRLMRAEPGLVPALHARASIWHERFGSPAEAIEHALAGGEVARAAGLVAVHWWGYVCAGREASVAAWLRRLSEDRAAASAVVAHCAAWVAALSGNRRLARRWLAVVEAGRHDGPLPDGAISLEFSAALLRGTFGFDGLRVALESAAHAAALADDPASSWYVVARTAYGWNLYLSGDAGRARTVLLEALLADTDAVPPRVLALAAMSLAASEAGLAAQAESAAHAAAELAAARVEGESPHAALASLAIGAVHAGQGLLADARSELEHALRTRPPWSRSSPWVLVETQLRLARVLLDLGDGAAAGDLLEKAGAVLRALPDGAEALQARLARLERRLAAAPRAQPSARSLSDRERAILRLLRGSLSRREIGRELGVSVNTVKTYTRAIYRKLGVSTREAAVARALDLGII